MRDRAEGFWLGISGKICSLVEVSVSCGGRGRSGSDVAVGMGWSLERRCHLHL